MNATQPIREKREDKWYLTRPKDLLPGSFSGKDEDWLKWKEDLEDYIETVHPGARDCCEQWQQRKKRSELTSSRARKSGKEDSRSSLSSRAKSSEKHGISSCEFTRQWLRGREEYGLPVRAAGGHSEDDRAGRAKSSAKQKKQQCA